MLLLLGYFTFLVNANHLFKLPDTVCSVDTIQKANDAILPILSTLVKTSAFRYFKANLHKDCPFWDENKLCTLRDCSVVEAQEDEIPVQWKKDSLSVVDYSSSSSPFSLKPKKPCLELKDQDFCYVEDEKDEDGIYINLLQNKERFTAYAGESANRVWSSIYNENCFQIHRVGGLKPSLADTCLEKRVFYKMISGLHASISMHICGEYLDRSTGFWGRNVTCYQNRYANHPDRIENLYFVWAVMVRAVSKLTPYLQNYPFCDGTGDEEVVVKHVDQVIQAVSACPSTFDETVLFADMPYESLKDDFRDSFRNISRIMDCVGCEKCRLWGKIQTSGLGTALKILFTLGDDPSKYKLSRPELISLINTFHQIARSVSLIEWFNNRVKHETDRQKQIEKLKQETNQVQSDTGKTDLKKQSITEDQKKNDKEKLEQNPKLKDNGSRQSRNDDESSNYNPLLDPLEFLKHQESVNYVRSGTFLGGLIIAILGFIRFVFKFFDAEKKYKERMIDFEKEQEKEKQEQEKLKKSHVTTTNVVDESNRTHHTPKSAKKRKNKSQSKK
ncbi:hypothetical protein BC833DRAFT_587072 [Globomyces pollinis-pini]|nr:hypothetical protein BC833DRAFT_587072 [Globomyces pollinis-pini]